MNWNDKSLERRYDWLTQDAKKRGFTDEELQEKYQYLNNPSLKTESARIHRMLELAYYLGMLREIRVIDEGKTPVTLDEQGKMLFRATYGDSHGAKVMPPDEMEKLIKGELPKASEETTQTMCDWLKHDVGDSCPGGCAWARGEDDSK